MGSSSSREPVESMKFVWPSLITGLTCHETEEMDPVIESSVHDTTLNHGEGQTFYVRYKAYRGPVTITLYLEPKKGREQKKLMSKSRLVPQGTFAFRIQNVRSFHNGTYTVEVLDSGRCETCSANPVRVAWDVTVEK